MGRGAQAIEAGTALAGLRSRRRLRNVGRDAHELVVSVSELLDQSTVPLSAVDRDVLEDFRADTHFSVLAETDDLPQLVRVTEYLAEHPDMTRSGFVLKPQYFDEKRTRRTFSREQFAGLDVSLRWHGRDFSVTLTEQARALLHVRLLRRRSPTR